jgi:hypothetical protein
MRRLALLVLLLVLPACGLSTPEGVRSAGDVQPVRDEPGALRVIPPGPQPGASPEDVVRGFLTAQSSPSGDHAVARQFLAPGTRWDDEQGAVIYSSRRFEADDDGDPLTLEVRFESTARIEPSGSFALDDEPVTAPYTLARQPNGEFRLTSVPDGLHLMDADRALAFQAYDVYFLARDLTGAATGRLVPDRVFLPVTAEPGAALAGALLRGPSLPLSAAATTALPPRTRTAPDVTVGPDDVVTVELPPEAAQLDTRQRQRLSAQFAWTLLPTFAGLRLRVGGRPYDVEGAGEVQTLADWREFDPAGVSPRAPLYYVQGRKLRVLDGSLPPSPVTSPGPLGVDEVAVSPTGGLLGLLTRTAAGVDEVRIGPPEGPFPVVLSGRGLGSLTWGPGAQGLWLLRGGAVPEVCLLPAPGTPPRQDPCDVTYDRPPEAGPLSGLRVSRDGARIAMVFGSGTARRLYVGRVVPGSGRLRIALGPDPRPVAPQLTNVTDVAWESGTGLVVLAAAGRATQVVVWRVPVDGSTGPAAVQRPGLPGDALAVAAAPDRPLVVSAVDDGRPRLYRDNGTLFDKREPGTAPAYPG